MLIHLPDADAAGDHREHQSRAPAGPGDTALPLRLRVGARLAGAVVRRVGAGLAGDEAGVRAPLMGLTVRGLAVRSLAVRGLAGLTGPARAGSLRARVEGSRRIRLPGTALRGSALMRPDRPGYA
ncbi:hypothetical protein [Nesterenkonia sp. HG001]|uniref:hypothetical protein n=1 Tax=Nesterenkonia sp. HG001 TaxID=2983207 RepID=UPI002ACBDD8E|nr:hypothetical protein [Nesterenkonia sp. HG001]